MFIRASVIAFVSILAITARASAQSPVPTGASDAVVDFGTALESRAATRDIEGARSRVLDGKFWALAGVLGTSMLLDTRSTFYVVDRCLDCREANPLVAPLVRLGPTPTYAAGVLVDIGVMAVAAKMKGSERAWVRRTWWVAPVALVIGHSLATRHNYNLVR